jgi:rare lipoprotein A (peptidoglycan hydrolase)
MRSIFKPVLASLPLALFALSPAHAAAEGWKQTCSGPAYVCGGETVATKTVAAKPAKKSPTFASKPAKAINSANVKAKKPVEVSSDDEQVKIKAKKKAAKVADAPVKVKKAKVAKAAVNNDDDEDAPKAKKKVAKASKGGGGSEYQSGMASWYGGNFNGRKTANGEIYNMNEMTAAHKTLPFGTLVRVTNTRNGDSVDVRINDRGPFVGGRVIDLSRAAANDIGVTASGVAPVKLTILGKG